MENNIVYFYDLESDLVRKEDIYLNNFDASEFIADDNFKYPTVEHYYQCHKFDSSDEFRNAFEEIRNASSALLSKKTARKYENSLSWEKEKWTSGYKDVIMKKGLMYKFSQNKDLLKRLLDTGDKKLIEASYQDPYWGGMLPDSKNKLGEFLEVLRDEYRKSEQVYLSDCGLEPIDVNLE